MIVALARLAAEPTEAEIADACGDSGWWCERVYHWTDNKAVAQAAGWIVDVPLKVVLILVVAFVVNRVARRAIQRGADRLAETHRGRLAELRDKAPDVLVAPPDARTAARLNTMTGVAKSLATVLVFTIAFIMILGTLGISIGPLIAGAGIAGIALGFGAQSLVKDFLSGLFMLLEDQYGVGDVIDAGEVGGARVAGVVESVSLRSTHLRGDDGTVWHVPNGEIRRIGNLSQQWSRAVLDIAVARGSDVDRASQVIESTAQAVAAEPGWADRVLEPPRVGGVEAVGAQGIVIRLAVKTTPGDQWELLRQLRVRIIDALDAAGIAIPLPGPGASPAS